MDQIILAAFIVVLLGIISFLFYLLDKEKTKNVQIQKSFHKNERVLLKQIKDLSDKVYFTKSQDFMSNKAIEELPKQEEKQEEQFIPLEEADPKEVLEALRNG